MSLQTIIDNAQNISVDRRAIVGQTISRAGYIVSSERGARTWKFTITPPQGWRWDQYRSVVEELDRIDRIQEQTIKLSNNNKMSWITGYKGQLTTGEIASIGVSAISGNTITLDTLPSVSSGTIMFEKGDYLQPQSGRYPYTILNTIYRGTESTVNVTLNRGIIPTSGVDYTAGGILTGTSITWRVYITKMPTWSLTPGRFIEWNDDFELMEALV